jgi:hypothetical protein
VRNQAKVLLSAVCARWGIENIEVSHPVVAYAVEYGTILLNRFEVGKDGRTSYERCKGKKATALGMEFGEAIYWRRKKIGGALGKMTSLWDEGVYLGIMGKSNEIIVGDERGVWKARSVMRKQLGEVLSEEVGRILEGGWGVAWRCGGEERSGAGDRDLGGGLGEVQGGRGAAEDLWWRSRRWGRVRRMGWWSVRSGR